MGDMGDFWGDTKEARKEESRKRKDRNHAHAIDQLAKNGVSSKSKDGVHYVVDSRFDYWPSTGLFINRKTKKRGRGIKNLLRALKEQQ